MDTATIVLGVGVFISLILGVINLLWGPAILAQKDRVAIVNSEVYAEFVRKGSCEIINRESLTLKEHIISIEARCELVLASGENEIEVKDVEVVFDKEACKNLRRYFHIPLHNKFRLRYTDIYEDFTSPMPIPLEPKKPLIFKCKFPLSCTDTFEKEYSKMENDSYPDFIQHLLDKLETRYQICWTRYDNKKLCWYFPDRWWRNLGRKLWG